MEILASHLYQKIRSQKVHKSQSVKYDLIIDDVAKNLLSNKLTEFYSKCGFLDKLRYFGFKKFNFEKILNSYKKAGQEVAEKSKGDIFLIKEAENSKIEIGFMPEIGAVGFKRGLNEEPRITVEPKDILPDKLFSGINPMKHAKELLEYRIWLLHNVNKRPKSPFMLMGEKDYCVGIRSYKGGKRA